MDTIKWFQLIPRPVAIYAQQQSAGHHPVIPAVDHTPHFSAARCHHAMETSSIESRIILAIRALKNDPALTVLSAATTYNVPRTTLRRRLAGQGSRRDIPANLRKLTDLEERVLLNRILDLDLRGFQPQLEDVREMADRLCTDRDASRVGPRWAENFVKRHPELTTRFRRRIDYQRAQCEDPDVVNAWFRLVRNMIAKYGIQEADIYNFDETGFLMGMLSSAKVVTSSERRSRPRTKQPGNREFVTPLDVGCFSSLKASYGKQIEKMMRMQITHITKDDFFDAFLEAFNIAMTENNVRAGFRATGLVPLNPEAVLFQLDPKPMTPSPPNTRLGTPQSWVTKTPKTASEITQQSTTIKNKIARHQNSSPTHMYDAGGSLSIQEAEDLIAEKDVGEQLKVETSRSSRRTQGAQVRARLCSVCSMAGHNARTCQVVVVTSEEEDSE
ncbi:hypothetical protein V500_04219 [Pseudogymnoascus sp. VKM F-4518 (FW-2643)]|nr:hypothetical protein V500_04219 [Pseudogymnoascus sp. VKM F-4518 (FW-2643)]